MTTEPYALWDLAPLALPPPSRLYALAPIAVGTPVGESLTSYVVRLAQAHRVSVRALVVHEIRPHLGPAAARAAYVGRLSGFWARDAATLNGTSGVTRTWVQALEWLTQRAKLADLTLLCWADVLAAAGLLRYRRAWCSHCYAAQQRDAVVYDPLLWSVAAVTVCVLHHSPLVQRCPNCGDEPPWLAPHARPGCCSSCGVWLGRTEGDEASSGADHQAAVQRAMGTATAVGALIAAAPRLTLTPPREQIARVVQAIVQRMPGQRAMLFAQVVDTTTSAVGAWQRGRCLPQLQNLLRVSTCVGLPLLQLLTDPTVETALQTAHITPLGDVSPTSRRPYRRLDIAAVARALQEVLSNPDDPPPSMREVGRRLGTDASHLRMRFPEECRRISAQYVTYWQAHSRQRHQQIDAEIRQAVREIHAHSQYPTLKRVAQALSNPNYMLAPEARATWRTALHDLGWNIDDGAAEAPVGHCGAHNESITWPTER